MKFYIVIPAHNEEAYLAKTLDSLTNQTLLPSKIVLVDDNSTDGTSAIIESYKSQYPFISSIKTKASTEHLPGAKIVAAFNQGLSTLDTNYDVLCKFDADLIFPENYLQELANHFKTNSRCGIAGGFCHVVRDKIWVLENLTSKDHVRGALKAYGKSCFQEIGGLKESMGWDTVDELLAKYHNWEVITDEKLVVKHLKPTASTYAKVAGRKQGRAFRKMRYGFILTVIASMKLSYRKQSFRYFIDCLQGYFNSCNGYLVNRDQGKFIRKLRWNNIWSKLF